MELALNFAWLVLTTLMCWLWMHYAPRKGADRRAQLVTLSLIILIVFPVISVTDDLLTAQNLAETDCCQREVHACANLHSRLHPVAELILPPLAEPSFDSFHSGVPKNHFAPLVNTPALSSIQNRPPPSA